MKLPNLLKKSGRSLRITLAAGLTFFILAGGALTVFYLLERNATKTARQKDNFARALREYDIQSEKTNTEKEYERLNRELDRIEKSAIGVESRLSVLKRRRALARIYPASAESYQKSINNALEVFPLSQPIIAVAAEALLNNSAINNEMAVTLRDYLLLLNDPAFNKLRIAFHVLLGDFRNPKTAADIPAQLFSDGTQDITIDLTILKIIRGDYQGAASDIQTIVYFLPSPDSFRLAAEFNYDFGDLQRSAELFFMINDEEAFVRQADALYLAGFQESARMIWFILADAPNRRSLYNLGVTSEDDAEAAFWLEKLINVNTEDDTFNLTDALVRQFGLIRRSRLQETSEAISTLQSSVKSQLSENPFIDLEICRRTAPSWALGRQIAEAWLLLDRHGGNEDMYEWAAWLFLFQRSYSEAKILLNRQEMFKFKEQWTKIYKALVLMFDGNLDDAQDIMLSIPTDEAEWPVHANLGRLMEAQHSPSKALEQYELAVSKAKNPGTAARIQIRIAKCLTALNRPIDSILALQYALELDSDNLTARIELDRLSRIDDKR